MTDATESLRVLEQRVQRLEDRLAIYQLLATYGPGVDSVSSRAVAALWMEDGVYDVGGQELLMGASEIGELVDREPHRTYVAAGCAHVISLPHLVLHGDKAVATCHSRLYVRDGPQWRIARLSANRWELVRTTEGWKVTRRTNRLLDGSEKSRDLFTEGLRQTPPAEVAG